MASWAVNNQKKWKKIQYEIFKSVFQTFKYGDASKVIFKMCQHKVIIFYFFYTF